MATTKQTSAAFMMAGLCLGQHPFALDVATFSMQSYLQKITSSQRQSNRKRWPYPIACPGQDPYRWHNRKVFSLCYPGGSEFEATALVSNRSSDVCQPCGMAESQNFVRPQGDRSYLTLRIDVVSKFGKYTLGHPGVVWSWNLCGAGAWRRRVGRALTARMPFSCLWFAPLPC